MNDNQASCFEALKAILTSKYDVHADMITPTATLGSLGLDSLTTVELAFDIEDRFQVKLDEDPLLMGRTLSEMMFKIMATAPDQKAA